MERPETLPAPPPGDIGQRLLPTLVDEIAAVDPHRVLYSVMRSRDSPGDGFLDVTAGQFAQAVGRCAWHLHGLLGRGDKFPTLTYLGPQDVMYAVLVLASIKTGYKLLLNSPRNSLDAHLALFSATDCHVFLMPPKFPLPVVKQILDARPMRVVEIPPLQHWIQEQDSPQESYPYDKTFAEARLEPFVVLHTSGSTGIPKPIIQTHGTLAPLDAFGALGSLGFPSVFPAALAGKRVYLGFPLFHCAGMSMLLAASLYNRFTIVLGPFPPSAEVINGIHVHGNVNASCLPPMSLIELAKDPEYLKNLGRLDEISYGGGPCPVEVGNLISQKTQLLNCLGTTECGVSAAQYCGSNWSYMSFSPAMGCEFREVSEGLYEQVIVRRPELDLYQGIFCTFPDLEEWPMKDLYTQHPNNKDQWLYKGRIDDIIVLGNGEKFNPVDMESIITAHPAVRGALVAGMGRLQASLLVELAKTPVGEEETTVLVDAIWPSIEAANKVSPSHGHIYRHMIVFTSLDKPMLRAGKGTIQRKMTLALYESEIAALYGALDGGADSVSVTETATAMPSDGETPEKVAKSIVSSSTGIDIGQLAAHDNLFDYGLDSLKIMVLTRDVNKLLAARGRPATLDVKSVYANPTLSRLIDLVKALLVDSSRPPQEEAALSLAGFYKLLSLDMPMSARSPQTPDSQSLVVLLTGSTGSLGSYILDSLTRNPNVSRVYCLNRGPGSQDRQARSLAGKGLPWPTKNVEFLDADFTKARFGLSRLDFMRLLKEVTNVIHNAWQVDFNLTLASFASQLAATRRLIDFSVHSYYGARLFFVSSVSTVSRIDGPVEERMYRDGAPFQDTGYGKSKYVAELLLDDVARESGLPTVVCRVGQIAGPTTEAGTWPRSEWFPSLIASSRYLGKLPSSLGYMDAVDWVPVDVLGQSIAELAIDASPPAETEAAGTTVFHAANPCRIPWAELVPTVLQAMGDGVETVPLEDWVAALKETEGRTEDLVHNPAVKIIEFYEDLCRETSREGFLLQTTASTKASKSLAGLSPVKPEWMSNWLVQWGMTEAE